MPTLKVAAICPTTELSHRHGEVRHKYAYPEDDLDTAVQRANAFVDHGVTLLRRAAEEGAVMACLPEGLPNLGRWRRKPDLALADIHEAWRRTWDHFQTTLSAAARELGIHVVAGGIEPNGQLFHNTAALFDDRGNYVGGYRKVQLVGSTCAEGKHLTPGDDTPVFDTRHGKVGLFICWDIMFPEITTALMVRGAQILFQPTYGHAGAQADFQAQTRAFDAVCPLVISMWCGNGRIINKDGQILARGSMFRDAMGVIPDQIVYGEVDPTTPRPFSFYRDFQQGLRYERRVPAYHALHDAAPQTDTGLDPAKVS